MHLNDGRKIMNYFCNKHYFTDSSGESLEHSANRKHAKYGTKNSTSSEKGTDGKKNNTSEYNHEYYEENTEKWEDNKKKNSTRSNDDDRFYDKDGNARFGHKDYDENDEDFKRTDGEKIEGTDLRTFTNKNGSTIIMGKGIKFSFPPGTKITSAMAKQIARIEAGDKSNKESYVAKMLNAVTGFADKQGLNTDTTGKKKSSSSSKTKSKPSEEKKETSEKSSSSGGGYEARKKEYYEKKDDANKTPDELKKEVNEKGKAKTEYYKKKNKSMKHSDFEDLGSILVKDLL